jgi:hypothetical protein
MPFLQVNMLPSPCHHRYELRHRLCQTSDSHPSELITTTAPTVRERAAHGRPGRAYSYVPRAPPADASLYRSVQRPQANDTARHPRKAATRRRSPCRLLPSFSKKKLPCRPGLRMGWARAPAAPPASALSTPRHRHQPQPPFPTDPQWRFLFAGLTCQPLPANSQLASVTQASPTTPPRRVGRV